MRKGNTMAQARSRRLRLLESLRRTINEMLHDRVHRAASTKGRGTPQNTQSIYTSAAEEAPELLDQLLFVHHRLGEEIGEATPIPDSLDDKERKAMLAAGRAAVNRTQERLQEKP